MATGAGHTKEAPEEVSPDIEMRGEHGLVRFGENVPGWFNVPLSLHVFEALLRECVNYRSSQVRAAVESVPATSPNPIYPTTLSTNLPRADIGWSAEWHRQPFSRVIRD